MQGLFVTLFMLCLASYSSCKRPVKAIPKKITFSVMDYGAVGDGVTDDSKAFLKAWGEACDRTGILQVPPKKMFMLNPLKFSGPCKFSSIHFKLKGNVIAPNSIEAWREYNDKTKWIQIVNVNGLIINGGGQIDGRGSPWWKDCYVDSCPRPKALLINNCNNLHLSGTHHVNSPKSQISINQCKNATLSYLTIIAPGNSPNTDGIDIAQSSFIYIHHSTISTGDDCIALNDGTSNINITYINCGPGHGISIGSLGRNGAYDTVEQVYVSYCSFNGTTNGVRIKTWQGGSGYVRNVKFEHITLTNTYNPIIINQEYRNIASKENLNQESGVEIIGVIYKDVKGTSASEVAINLNCRSSKGCSDIIMEEINIAPSNTMAICNYARGKASFVSPKVPCLV
ncbi:hypothetical protein TanjilG_16204 [Lupinus angustifolius]|uniref:Polygalacturonase n=1 Tax=Lupinus angustifolius TaxID=3871 RepID=A0A1J7GAQ3_LUPAN|nr:PREDICTED: probable polygalacturonase At3g15720 [Lupinus angustifolius]OIV97443.1 hypothetical protein TanjilG_16204 [Lupinus angustifolius]